MNSMTGFGAATAPLASASLRVEIGGVNRKQTEVAVTLPRAWAALETTVRELVAGAVSRGRVNISISLQQTAGGAAPITINRERLTALTAQLAELENTLGKPVDTSLDALLRLGILAEEMESDLPLETVEAAVVPAVQEALHAFLTLRAQEGANMKQDLLTRINTLRGYRVALMERASGVALRHREALLKRLEESGLPIPADDERIIKEIALFADRCDVTEEMTRLESHLNQFERICDKTEAVGRTLDFLCQEIFRELNTTGSKANDAELAQMVVSAKTELEKIREQVQNIE
ncbi:MAG: YicC family protein [Akkermansiaceae bacterium]|nr:YicC family protein [Akkermansiaceae bacterium]